MEIKIDFIRFAKIYKIIRNMSLEFLVKPDIIIRILMTYKGIKKLLTFENRVYKTPNRTGFVAIE